MNQNVLITGGCGFVGSGIAIALRQAGFCVTCLDNLSRRGSELTRSRIERAGCQFLHADLRNPEDLQRYREPVDILIECSADPSVLVGSSPDDALFAVRNNLDSTTTALEFARSRGSALIFFSTSRVYPWTSLGQLPLRDDGSRFEIQGTGTGWSINGIATDYPLEGVRTLYGATKLASEFLIREYAHSFGIPAVINRCGVIAGPWQMGKVDQGFVTHWIACHVFKKPLVYLGYGGCGHQVRDLLHIDDLVNLVLLQIRSISGFRGETFHAGGGRTCNVSLVEATMLARETTGSRIDVGMNPDQRPGDLPWFIMDNSHTTERLGWTPTKTADDVFRDITRWMLDHRTLLEPLFTRT